MYTIQNSELSVTVSPVGAELQSVRDVRSATEYLWQGDSRWWSGRSPILFPIVGGLWNGTCRLGDTTMQLAKHGFVRRRPWRMVEHEAQRVCFELVGTVGDYAVYPFATPRSTSRAGVTRSPSTATCSSKAARRAWSVWANRAAGCPNATPCPARPTAWCP